MGWILALTVSRSVALGRLLGLSAASCSHMENEGNSSHLIALSQRFKEFIHKNHFEEYPAPRRPSECCFHHYFDPLCH